MTPSVTIASFNEAVRRLVTVLREFAPYAAIELIVPGGSVMALLLWLHRRRKSRETRQARQEIPAPLLALDTIADCSSS